MRENIAILKSSEREMEMSNTDRFSADSKVSVVFSDGVTREVGMRRINPEVDVIAAFLGDEYWPHEDGYEISISAADIWHAVKI